MKNDYIYTFYKDFRHYLWDSKIIDKGFLRKETALWPTYKSKYEVGTLSKHVLYCTFLFVTGIIRGNIGRCCTNAITSTFSQKYNTFENFPE